MMSERVGFWGTGQRRLKQSSLILVQEYTYTKFVWRIGVLNLQPILTSQSFTSERGWQARWARSYPVR